MKLLETARRYRPIGITTT